MRAKGVGAVKREGRVSSERLEGWLEETHHFVAADAGKMVPHEASRPGFGELDEGSAG